MPQTWVSRVWLIVNVAQRMWKFLAKKWKMSFSILKSFRENALMSWMCYPVIQLIKCPWHWTRSQEIFVLTLSLTYVSKLLHLSLSFLLWVNEKLELDYLQGLIQFLHFIIPYFKKEIVLEYTLYHLWF